MELNTEEYIKNCLKKDLETQMETLQRLNALRLKPMLNASRAGDKGFDTRHLADPGTSEPTRFSHDIGSVMRRARMNDPDGLSGGGGSWN